MTWLAIRALLGRVSPRAWAAIAAVLLVWWLVHSKNVAKATAARLEGEKNAAILESKKDIKRIEREHETIAARARARVVAARNDASSAADAASRALERVRIKPVAGCQADPALVAGSAPATEADVVPAELLRGCSARIRELATLAEKLYISNETCVAEYGSIEVKGTP